MYEIIKSKTRKDPQLPDRYYPLHIYTKILEGTLYDCFKWSYHNEYVGGVMNPRYVEESERSPCVNTGLNLMRSIVEESVSFLFGENRFPVILTEDQDMQEMIANIIQDGHLVHLFQEAATRGSIGSVAIQLRVLADRFFPVTHYTTYLTPEFDKNAPDTLTKIVEKRKVLGQDLANVGYDIDSKDYKTWFWFMRVWDDQDETWYQPWPVAKDDQKPQKDTKRSVNHKLSMVPWIWCKNLVGTGSDVDGGCTFEPAIENAIQIDYALSRADRTLKYNADPLTVFKVRNPSQVADFVRASGNAVVLGVEGDAKILEVTGDAAHSIIETVAALKDEALHSIHGFRANPDKLATSQSSIAQRMLYLPMIQLASQLRLSYGDGGIIPLLRMMLRIAAKMPIKVLGKTIKVSDPEAVMTLEWADWFVPTPQDFQMDATTLIALVQGGLLSKKTALRQLSKYCEILDLDQELTEIDKDAQKQVELLGDQTEATASMEAKYAPKPKPNGSAASK